MKKKTRKKLAIIVGVPLAVGTAAYIGGKLPGVMGATMTSVITPAVPIAGFVSGVTALSLGVDAVKSFPKLKRRKYFRRWRNPIYLNPNARLI